MLFKVKETKKHENICSIQGTKKGNKGKKKSRLFNEHKRKSTRKFQLLKKLKTPSRLEILPYYKKSKVKSKCYKPLKLSKKMKSPPKNFLALSMGPMTSNTSNLYKRSFIASPITQTYHKTTDISSKKKIFKLADFGLCVNVRRSKPFQFGCNQYLAPEVLQHGPDNPKVRSTVFGNFSWIMLNWIFSHLE